MIRLAGVNVCVCVASVAYVLCDNTYKWCNEVTRKKQNFISVSARRIYCINNSDTRSAQIKIFCIIISAADDKLQDDDRNRFTLQVDNATGNNLQAF